MATYLVTLQYDVPKSCTFTIEAASEAEAESKARTLESEGVGEFFDGDAASELYCAECREADPEEVMFVLGVPAQEG